MTAASMDMAMVADGAAPTQNWAEATDDALMAAYQAGDQRAFAEIVRRYSGLIRGLARRQFSSEADQKDLVQQTFLQLHRCRSDYRGQDKLRPWLATIALNLARMQHRSRGRRPEVSTEPATMEERPGPAFDEKVESADTRRQVRRALEKLPADQREVIELHWFQQLSFREVAESVGASLSAVKVRAHRGYKRLKTALEPEMDA